MKINKITIKLRKGMSGGEKKIRIETTDNGGSM
jgi:hypothetical protein